MNLDDKPTREEAAFVRSLVETVGDRNEEEVGKIMQSNDSKVRTIIKRILILRSQYDQKFNVRTEKERQYAVNTNMKTVFSYNGNDIFNFLKDYFFGENE